jgi:hypothetical protein
MRLVEVVMKKRCKNAEVSRIGKDAWIEPVARTLCKHDGKDSAEAGKFVRRHASKSAIGKRNVRLQKTRFARANAFTNYRTSRGSEDEYQADGG